MDRIPVSSFPAGLKRTQGCGPFVFKIAKSTLQNVDNLLYLCSPCTRVRGLAVLLWNSFSGHMIIW